MSKLWAIIYQLKDRLQPVAVNSGLFIAIHGRCDP